jgi:hypothetical protein
MAYEREDGPIGSRWSDETMAALHEQIQRLNHLLGAAHFTDRKHKKNPVPSPKHYPRPYEIFEKDRPDHYDPEEDQMDTGALETFGTENEIEEDQASGNDH